MGRRTELTPEEVHELLLITGQNDYEIVGLCGRKRVGKDTVAGWFEQEGFVNIKFTDALWEFLIAFNPIVDVLNNGCPLRLNEVLAGYDRDDAKERFPEIGRLMQAVGTDAVRDILGQDTWINILKDRILRGPGTKFVVSDVRFLDETHMLRRLGAKIIKIERNTSQSTDKRDPNHRSERELEQIKYDVLFKNDGSHKDCEDFVFDFLHPEDD